jgi:hypothetical protein
MSDASNQNANIDVYSRYAPKRIREAISQGGSRRNAGTFGPPQGEKLTAIETPRRLVEERVAAKGFRFDRSTSTQLPPTLSPFASRPIRGVVGSRSAGRSAATRALFLFIVVGASSVTVTNGRTGTNNGLNSIRSPHENTKSVERGGHASPKLLVTESGPRNVGVPSPLGISVADLSGGGLIVVKGLAAGTQLSAGSPADNDSWWLSAKDLESVMVLPPSTFVGSMELGVELRLADTTLSDYRILHFEWANTPASEPDLNASPRTEATSRVIHQLASDEIQALMKRGKDLIANGDFAAARLVLQRPAESGSAHAALMLAGTYDPMVLKNLRAYGCAPDIQKARYWYQKANELGSPDAPKRLKLLAARRD